MCDYVSWICPKSYFRLLSNSTLIANSMISKRVYMGCIVSVSSKETMVNLMGLDLVDLMIPRE